MPNPPVPTAKPVESTPLPTQKRRNPFFGVMPIAIMALSISLFLLLVLLTVQD